MSSVMLLVCILQGENTEIREHKERKERKKTCLPKHKAETGVDISDYIYGLYFNHILNG